MNRCERVLTTCNARRCPLDVVASNGEKACRVVQFDASTSVPPVWEFAGDQDMIAGAGWRYLRIGVESCDDVQRRIVDVVCLGIAAVVQVDADDGIVVSKHEPDTISVLRLGVLECCLETRPRFRLC